MDMDGKTASAPRVKYYVERQSAFCQAAVILMLLSATFRIIGCWGLWGDPFFAATQIALPLGCNVLFILCLLLLGKHLFSLTSLPVLLGVVFFIIKSFTFDSWIHTILCILLYLLVAVLYTATAFGALRTKWLLVPLFGLPFIYHIFVEDLPALSDGTLSFAAGMQEMSVLCVMLALLCTAFAMKKKKPVSPEEPTRPRGLRAFYEKKAPGEHKDPETVPAEPVEAAPVGEALPVLTGEPAEAVPAPTEAATAADEEETKEGAESTP